MTRAWRLAVASAVAAGLVVAALPGRTHQVETLVAVHLVPADALPPVAEPSPPGTRLVRLDPADPTHATDLLGAFAIAGPPDVAFDGRSLLVSARREGEEHFALWRVPVGGGSPTLVHRGETHCVAPVALGDGRIVYAEGGETGPRHLFVLDPETGARDQITFGDGRYWPLEVLADGRLRLLRRRPGAAPEAMTVKPDGTGIARWVDRGRPGGHAFVPCATPGNGSELVGLCQADQVTGVVGAVVHVEPGYRVTGAAELGARPAPPTLASMVKPSAASGWVLCLDAFESVIAGSEGWRERGPARVRVLDLDAGATLGEAPIAGDGSFYVEVPADRSLGLETVDRDGATLATLASGIWVRPNEHRGCVGCHESPYLTPANRSPLAVADGPWTLTGGSP